MQKNKIFIVYLILLNAFPMLSTDLYLPALPEIAAFYETSYAMTNLTMIAFTGTLAVSSLLWGPGSDKFGRKPTIICGGAFYLIGSLLCVFSPSINFIIFSRILQAFGGGAALMTSNALVKDVYSEDKQEKVLSLVQGLSLIWPVIAPSLGAFVLRYTNWQGIFVIMAVIGAVSLIGSLPLKETLREPLTMSVWLTFSRLWVVMRNKRFAMVAIILSITSIPTMAFINASTYIFQNRFGSTEQEFGYFFAISAASMMGGTLIYYTFSRHFGRRAAAYACFGVVALCGVGILLVGGISPWIFMCFIGPSSFFSSFSRPLGTFMALNAQEKDTGSASSLFTFFALLFASLGMLSLALFSDYLNGVGILYLLFGAIGVFSFAICLHKSS